MFRYRKAFYITGFTLLFISLSFSIFFALKALSFDSRIETQPIPKKLTYHFFLIPQEMDNEYWRLVGEGAKAAEKLYGVRIEYNGPSQSDIEEHIKFIEMAIAAKVDGIMTQGLSDSQFAPVINKAVEKGIPVITVDTDAPTSNRLAYIGTDNYYAGFIASQALVRDTKGKAIVGIITGSLDTNHQQLRVKGFQDAVQQEPGIRIVAIEESNITRIEAAEKTRKILKDHPDVTAFFGTSALDGLGIAQVVERLYKDKEIYIMAFDTLPETLELIKKGTIKATVVQEAYEMGFKSVELMLEVIKGKPVPILNHTNTSVIYKKDLSIFTQSGQQEVN